MKSYRVRWVKPDGSEGQSQVSYDAKSAEDRRERLESEGATDIVVYEVKPGE